MHPGPAPSPDSPPAIGYTGKEARTYVPQSGKEGAGRQLCRPSDLVFRSPMADTSSHRAVAKSAAIFDLRQAAQIITAQYIRRLKAEAFNRFLWTASAEVSVACECDSVVTRQLRKTVSATSLFFVTCN